MSETKAEKKPNLFKSATKRITKFFFDCKGEIKKIIWPTPKTVFRNFGIVLVTVLILTLFIFLLDTVFMGLLSLVMDIAN